VKRLVLSVHPVLKEIEMVDAQSVLFLVVQLVSASQFPAVLWQNLVILLLYIDP